MTLESVTSKSRLNAYIQALRPRTLTAALVPVIVGTAFMPQALSNVNMVLFFSILMTALFIQVGTNLINDAYDFVKGADTHARLGPKRLIQTFHFNPKTILFAGSLFFLAAFIAAIPFLLVGGMFFVALLLLSFFCGWIYTAGPYSLAYNGLGEVFVILFFGLVLTASSFYFQTGEINRDILLAGLQIGLLTTSLIAINNLRDINQDRAVGKRTLAVRFGERFAKFEICLTILLPYLINFFWLDKGFVAFLFPLFTLPMAYNLLIGIAKTRPCRHYNQFLQDAGVLHLCFGLFLAIGIRLA